ncbi:serine protease snake [Drosophila bipectinata]|uniref:serine protease snake n=1 Tax=Drosophila bipectinata TaxID=42026 RepID=UPI0038B4107A
MPSYGFCVTLLFVIVVILISSALVYTQWNPPMVSVDNYGNCQAYDRPLVGRCVRYGDCISAIQSAHQVVPLLCPSASPENFVCCPHGGYVMQPPRISMSENACKSAYPRSRHKRHRRHRDVNAHKDQVEVTEPIIQKRNNSILNVVGGRITLQNEYPYMCALGWPSRDGQRWIPGRAGGSAVRRYVFNCGCVLIAPQFALTAAHCANIGGESPTVALIGGGELNNSNGQLNEIHYLIKHPNFDPVTMSNDLAIVRLARRSQKPVACLWNQESVPERPLTALGYGQTKFAGPHSNELLQVLLYPLDNTRCLHFMQQDDKLTNGLSPGQLCAGDYSGRMDTCQGDSGGPLVLYERVRHHHQMIPYLVGITSFGGACASGQPGIYVRIVHYIQWIEQHVWS